MRSEIDMGSVFEVLVPLANAADLRQMRQQLEPLEKSMQKALASMETGLTGFNEVEIEGAPEEAAVIKALSLVPDGVRWLKDLSNAQYLPMAAGQMMDFSRGRGPLSRAQTELIAGRVSALNECFY